MNEAVDFGSAENIPAGRAIPQTGQGAASLRQRLTAPPPLGNGHTRGVPIDQLESHDPVPLRGGRLAPPPFRGLGELTTEGLGPEYDDNPRQEAETSRAYDPMKHLAREVAAPLADPRTFPQSRNTIGLSLRPLHDEDVDLLWDWIRTEEDRATEFFGEYIKTALHLHQRMAELYRLEGERQAFVRAIDVGGEFAGVAVAWPIHVKDNIANLHLYIAPTLRHDKALTVILPPLIDEGERLIPAPLRLAVVSDRGAWTNYLSPLGFVAHTVLIRER